MRWWRVKTPCSSPASSPPLLVNLLYPLQPLLLNVRAPCSQLEAETALESPPSCMGLCSGWSYPSLCLTGLVSGSQTFYQHRALTPEKITLSWHRDTISPFAVNKWRASKWLHPTGLPQTYLVGINLIPHIGPCLATADGVGKTLEPSKTNQG